MNKKLIIYFICFLALGFISGCKKKVEVSNVDKNLYGYWTTEHNNVLCFWAIDLKVNNTGMEGWDGYSDDCRKGLFNGTNGYKNLYMIGDIIHIGRHKYKISEFPHTTGSLSGNGSTEWTMIVSGQRVYKYE